MHIIQMAQEQHAIYFGYAFFRRFRQILQELKCKLTPDHSCKFAAVTIKNHRRVKTCQAENGMM